MDAAEAVLYLVAAGYGGGVAVSAALHRRGEAALYAGLLAAALASALSAALSLASMVWGIRWGGGILVLEGPAAFFSFIVGVAGAAASVYGVDYMGHGGGVRGAWLYAAMLNLFLLSMTLIPASRDLLLTAYLWEAMTIASVVLVAWDYRGEGVEEASKQYMYTMLLLNTFPLAGAVILTYAYTGSTGIEAASSLPYAPRIAVAAMLYIVFASKTGLFPLHFWLPDAHPAAPSNVSALLSGVMVKMGIYGLAFILPRLAPWPLYVILLLQAVASIAWGSLHAVLENDAKRLLAYSTVSHVGYIAVPLSAAYLVMGVSPVASAALLSSVLLYVVAHSLFKTLMFLSAGVLLHLAGTRSLDAYEGLGWADNLLAASLLVGGLSLAGLPPLIGYMAKATIYGSLLLSANPVTVAAAVAALALSPLTLLYSYKLLSPLRLPGRFEAVPPLMRLGLAVPLASILVFSVVSINGLCVSAAAGFLGEWVSLGGSPLIHVVEPYIYYYPLVLVAVLAAAAAASLIVERRGDVAYTGVWTTGYRIPMELHRVRPSYMYAEVERLVEQLLGFGHEVYRCIVWRFTAAIASTGAATRVAETMGRFNAWLASKLQGFAERLSRGGEIMLDEAAGSMIASGIRSVAAFIRVAAVTPIGLLAAAVAFLALIALVLALAAGGVLP